MEINFSKLTVYPDEYDVYWELPVTYPILFGRPERPIEDWHHHYGRAALYFVFKDTQATANTSIEFIDPDGASRGKYTKTLSTDQGYGCSYTDFDKVGVWKIKGTLNGMVKTWDALNIVEIDVPPPPPPPPPDPIQNVLCWNPYTARFEAEFVDVEQGKVVGVKFTVENILEHTHNFRAVVHIINSAGSSRRFDSELISISPEGKHTFKCEKLDGWQTLGLCTANINIYEVTQYYSHLRWSYSGAPIANIVQEVPPPPVEDFNLEITQYQRV